MASTQMVRKWEVPEHPEIEWALRTGYPSWMQEKGSDASAASGGRSELSEWQRSKKSRKSVSPMIFSGTATEVKGEWLGDWKKPIYKITYDEQNECNIVYVKVFGKARAICGSKVDLSVKILCNGVTPRHERDIFFEGDQLYMSFLSPVEGYLCVYLVDEEANAFCLLPYEFNVDGVEFVSANKDHIFFSKQLSEQPEFVDEYVMSCAHDGETNIFYVIYSPNKFTKAVDHSSSASLQQLSFQNLQEWLLEAQTKDPLLQVIRKNIIIKKLK